LVHLYIRTNQIKMESKKEHDNEDFWEDTKKEGLLNNEVGQSAKIMLARRGFPIGVVDPHVHDVEEGDEFEDPKDDETHPGIEEVLDKLSKLEEAEKNLANIARNKKRTLKYIKERFTAVVTEQQEQIIEQQQEISKLTFKVMILEQRQKKMKV